MADMGIGAVVMPRLPGYHHVKGFNIPITTKGPEVQKCLDVCYPALRAQFPGESKKNKSIAAAICHKRCG